MSTTIGDAVLHVISAFSGQLGEEALAQAPHLFAQIVNAPGLSQCLIGILQSPAQYPTPVRMQASTLLKRLIQDTWEHENMNNAVTEQEEDILANAHISSEINEMAQKIAQLRGLQQQMNDTDKDFLRNTLPSLLSDQISSLRSNVALSIAIIGKHDFPEKWPNLLQGLLMAIQNPDPNVVQGGLLCFNSLLDEVIDKTLQNVASDLFQSLVIILQNPITNAEIRVQSLDLYCAFVRSFAMIEDPNSKNFEKKFSPYLLPSLLPMVNLCLSYIDAPIDVSNPASCQFETRGAAMKAITRLITYFPNSLKSVIDTQNILLDRVATGFHTAINVFIDNLIICSDSMDVNEEITTGLIFFLNCVIALVDIMTENTRLFPKFIMSKLDKFLPPLCHTLLMVQEDVEKYSSDINEFIGDENFFNYNESSESMLSISDTEKTAAVRNESLRFIRIALHKWSKAGPTLVAKTATELWQRGSVMKQNYQNNAQNQQNNGQNGQNNGQNGDKNALWWKFHEAALISIGSLISSDKAYELPVVETTFPIATVVDMIQELVQNSDFMQSNPHQVFLQSRAMWLLSHCICKLTGTMTGYLHKTKQYDLATSTQQLLYRCLNMLPVALTQGAIQTQIATANAVSMCQQSFLAIDHSVLYFQCQQANEQFYQQHPELKGDYDRCMASGELIPIQQQYVNTIPLTVQTGFAHHFPIYLERFCTLLTQVEDQGMVSMMSCIYWIFSFFTQWKGQIDQLIDSYPYIQFTTTNPSPNSPATLLSQFEPHAATLTPQLMSNVVSTVLNVWIKNSNHEEFSSLVVDFFHCIAELKNNHIDSWALQAYNYLLSFIRSTPITTRSGESDDLSDAGAKMAAIGFLSIILRCLSPGPFFQSTSSNIDPSKQSNIPLITSLEQFQQTVATTTTSFQPLKISIVIPIEEVLNVFFPTIVQLGVTGQDKMLTLGATAMSSSILAMYSPYLLNSYANQATAPFPQLFEMLQKLAMILVRLDNNTDQQKSVISSPNSTQSLQDILDITDRESPLACRLIGQLLITYKSVIGDIAWKNLLNIIIMKLCTTTEYSLQFSCVLLLSRVGLHHSSALLQYLATECGSIEVKKLLKAGQTIKSKKTGFYVTTKDQYESIQEPIFFRTMNVFLKTIPSLTSGYIRRIALLFLCQCLSDNTCVQLLSQLNNIEDEIITTTTTPSATSNGSIFASKSSMTTRSKGTVVEKYSTCSAITKALKLLCEYGYQALILSIDRINDNDDDGLGLHDDDDNDTDDEEEGCITGGKNEQENDDDITKALFGNAGTLKQDGDGTAMSGLISLEELLDGEDDDDLGDDHGSDRDNYPESAYDVFYGIEVAQLISSFIKQQDILMNQNQGPFAMVKEQLTSVQLNQFLALKDPVGFANHHRQQKKLEKMQKQQQQQNQQQQQQ